MNTTLLKTVGNMNQLAGARSSTLSDGNGKGTQLIEVWNAAGLRFSCAADKCMDLYDFSYKGTNIAFHSKNGLVGNQFFSAMEHEFFEYWSGGMLATCGLDNVGGSVKEDGCTYPIHGRIGNAAAERRSIDAGWVGDDYIISLKGTMNSTRLYGRNLQLERTIKTSLLSKHIELTDTITNYSSVDAEFMILYHFNFGYPLLSEQSYFFSSKSDTVQREGEPADFTGMSPPTDDAQQQVFIHQPACKGTTYAGIINPERKLAAYLKYNSEALPVFLEWKCLKSHDYVVGIEPSNCFATSRSGERQNGTLPVLPAYQSVTYSIQLCIADGYEEIEALLNKCNKGD